MQVSADADAPVFGVPLSHQGSQTAYPLPIKTVY